MLVYQLQTAVVMRVRTKGCGQQRQNCILLVLLQRKVYEIVPKYLLLLANILIKLRILSKSFICKNETTYLKWNSCMGLSTFP